MKNIFRGYRGKLLLLVIIGCVYYFVPFIRTNVNQAFFILSNVDVEMARGYILSFGIWAPIVSFLLMILQSVAAPLPATIVYSYIGGMLTGGVRTMVMGLLILFALSALIVLLRNVWKDKKNKEGNAFAAEI